MLEDVQAPDRGLRSRLPGATTVDYFITNPNRITPGVPAPTRRFEKAIHSYNALEVTLTSASRTAGRCRLRIATRGCSGTFEGFFRDDNGQSDPGITSLFDFPTNDPSYTAIGVPQFGFRGDIRFLGALGEGPLPNDRPHQGKVFGNYVWNNGQRRRRAVPQHRQPADRAGCQSGV